jgi:hypothetical protein
MTSTEYLKHILCNWDEFIRTHKNVGKAIKDILEENHKYELALFVLIRNNIVYQGSQLGKTESEIDEMAIKTMVEMLSMIDYEKAEKTYQRALRERENYG